MFRLKENTWVENDEIRIVKSDFTFPNWEENAETYSCLVYLRHHLYEPRAGYGMAPFDVAVIKTDRIIGTR